MILSVMSTPKYTISYHFEVYLRKEREDWKRRIMGSEGGTHKRVGLFYWNADKFWSLKSYIGRVKNNFG